MTTPADLLAMHADMKLVCDDQELLCCKFNMFCSSPVILHVVEDAQLSNSKDGYLRVPFPGVPSAPLKLAIDVIHGVTRIAEHLLNDAILLLEGLDVLGNTTLAPVVIQRFWTLVSAIKPLSAFVPYVSKLFMHTCLVSNAITRLSDLAPLWASIEPILREQAGITPCVSSEVVAALAKRFSPVLIMRLMLDIYAGYGTTTPEDYLKLFCAGASMHPIEVPCILKMLTAVFIEKKWDTTTIQFMQNLQSANQLYESVPFNPKHKALGSMLSFHNTPMVSLLVDVSEVPRSKRTSYKLSPWLTMTFDFVDGIVDARLNVARIDDPLAKTATSFECRIMCITHEKCHSGEVWYSFQHVSPADEHTTENVPVLCGSSDTFRETMLLPGPMHVRCDLFFGAVSRLAAYTN